MRRPRGRGPSRPCLRLCSTFLSTVACLDLSFVKIHGPDRGCLRVLQIVAARVAKSLGQEPIKPTGGSHAAVSGSDVTGVSWCVVFSLSVDSRLHL